MGLLYRLGYLCKIMPWEGCCVVSVEPALLGSRNMSYILASCSSCSFALAAAFVSNLWLRSPVTYFMRSGGLSASSGQYINRAESRKQAVALTCTGVYEVKENIIRKRSNQ